MRRVNPAELLPYRAPQLVRAAIIAGVWMLFYILLVMFGGQSRPPDRQIAGAFSGSAVHGRVASPDVSANGGSMNLPLNPR